MSAQGPQFGALLFFVSKVLRSGFLQRWSAPFCQSGLESAEKAANCGTLFAERLYPMADTALRRSVRMQWASSWIQWLLGNIACF